jgi:two-component system sensor histidine kinase AtoS
VIERIFYRLQEKAIRGNIELILRSKEKDYQAWIDQRSLERVLINFINNSIDAIGSEGGAVSVILSSSEEHSGYITIQIADTGKGIPPEIKDNLYQKFASSKPEGTGLGLFISRKIIEFHKGWIDLETFPGGTLFNIYIPKEKRGDSQ